jgi:hypothetical protein
MPTRENTWTERKPYPPEAREKYGATTPSLGAHEEHTDLVEASHVAAPSEREIRARQAERNPPHALGYGGIGELDDRDFLDAELTYGLDPGTPASGSIPVGAMESEGAAEDEDRGGASEAATTQDDDDDEAGRASHAPEASGMRSTFPSLDHITLPP